MNKLRRVITYHSEGKSKSFISSSLQVSRNTVKKYIDRFIKLRLTTDQVVELSDLELDRLFLHPEPQSLSPRHQVLYDFFPYAEKRLRKKGWTKQLLWEEYKGKNPDGVGRSQFCDHFNHCPEKKVVVFNFRMACKFNLIYIIICANDGE